MGESIQKRLGRVRPPRVQITYDVEIGDAIVKKELPFVMGIIADLGGDPAARDEKDPKIPPYKERAFAAVDRDNFDALMKDITPMLRLTKLPRIIGGECGYAPDVSDAEARKAITSAAEPNFACTLRFEKLDDFAPGNLVRQVESLNTFFERRNRLQDLAAKLDGNDALQEALRGLLFPDSPGAGGDESLKPLQAELEAARKALEEAGDEEKAAKRQAVADAEAKLEKARAASGESVDRNGIIAMMVRQTGDDFEDKRQQRVAEERLDACLAEHKEAAFTLPKSESVVDMLSERVAGKDRLLALQMDEILHAPAFQTLEATWRGLHYLVFNTETSDRLKLRLFNAAFAELRSDLERAVEFDQSLLFKRVYEEEYGTFGGEPYSCLLHVHEYGISAVELGVLKKMAEVAAAAHTPMISAASPHFFGMESFTELPLPRDLHKIFQSADYIEWRSFRETDDARYVSLCLPHMLMRLPYGMDTNPVEAFAYEESVEGNAPDKYLWGNAAFALAGCVTAAFARYGWTAAIRGYEGGGAVEELPIYKYMQSNGEKVALCPTETSITDRREKELSDLGFIALIYRKNSDKAAFFSGQTIQNPPAYSTDSANANARISARLPYLLNASRFAHYVKANMRDKVGSFMTQDNVSKYLNNWISQYVLLSDDAGEEIKARYPLREARVDVTEDRSNPGAYKCVIFLRPHFQLEELTASIRLVAELPPPAA